MVLPHFLGREWGSRGFKHIVLHLVLIYMDERDLATLESWQADHLRQSKPDHWLPFISDQDLINWQNLIYDQIKPGGVSQTLEIFGQRISKTPPELRAMLDSPARMQEDLWDNIPREVLVDVEAAMYLHARQSLSEFLSKSG
jgi:hypothetical protein